MPTTSLLTESPHLATISCPRDGDHLLPQSSMQHKGHCCRRCFGLWMPPGLLNVSALRLKNSQGLASTLCCPHDLTPLAIIKHHGVEIDVCTTCGGIWMDQGEWERIVLLKKHKGPPSTDKSRMMLEGADLLLDAVPAALEGAGAVVEIAGEAGVTVLEFVLGALA